MTSSSNAEHFSAVLMYHRMGFPKLSSLVAGQYVTPSLLASQIKHLNSKGWNSVDLDDILAGPDQNTSRCRFTITFDDGYSSVYKLAYPLLLERGVKGTIYVVTSQIGGINQWDRAAGDHLETMMNADQIKEMKNAGFDIGSHTLTHPHLTQLQDKELKAEIVDSKAALEDVLDCEVTSFSYPYGDFDDRVKQVVIEAGYKNALSTKLGIVLPSTDLFEVPRVNVRWNSFGFSLMNKIMRGVRRSLGS